MELLVISYFLCILAISYFLCCHVKKNKKKKTPVKGGEILFIRGTYKECTGWLDTRNKSKKKSKMIWVVVNDEDYDEEVHTQV
jgi:hypothetical protein